MKKKNIIKRNEDYNRMIQTIRPYRYKEFLCYCEKVGELDYHFGFSVSKKICNAVSRNRIKRQLKSILDEKDYQNGFNCIIMVRKGILEKTYAEMKQDLEVCLNALKVIKGEQE